MKYPELFKPYSIGRVRIKNRIAMSAMLPIGWFEANQIVSDHIISYYEERAKNGVGLIFTGSNVPNTGLERSVTTACPFVDPERFQVQIKKLADKLHAYGCKLFVQVWLGSGRVAFPDLYMRGVPISSDENNNRWDPSIKCRKLTTEEVQQLILAAIDAAALCQRSGADGVDINGAKGGYLGDQFATEYFNHRDDQYGGSVENRVRVLTEIRAGIREKCGPFFPVTTRIGTKAHMKAEGQGALPGEPYTELGRDMEESIEVAHILEKAGYDGVLFGTGSYDAFYWLYPPMYMEDACWLEEAAELKRNLQIPVILPGKMNNPEDAARAVRENLVDAVAVGRGMLADPAWCAKVRAGQDEEIRPCIGCNTGCLARIFQGFPMSCAVNADLFYEAEMQSKYRKAEISKRIAIIGGGIAGMEAARVAAIRGHKVTIYEKGSEFGGMMLPAEAAFFKTADRRLLKWYTRQLAKLDVDIQFNREMSKEDVLSLDADEIIIAAGAKPKIPPIPGIHGKNVMTGIEYLSGKRAPGEMNVVIGGGQVGCETALQLVHDGHKAAVVEALPELLLGGGAEKISPANGDMLKDMLVYNHCDIYTSSAVQKIEEDGVVIKKADGEVAKISCDAVILSIGFGADQSLYEAVYQETEKPVWCIGDNNMPGNFMTAVKAGNLVAARI